MNLFETVWPVHHTGNDKDAAMKCGKRLAEMLGLQLIAVELVHELAMDGALRSAYRNSAWVTWERVETPAVKRGKGITHTASLVYRLYAQDSQGLPVPVTPATRKVVMA